jgi:hypothetical protein
MKPIEAYKKFADPRDRALESIFNHRRAIINDDIRGTLGYIADCFVKGVMPHNDVMFASANRVGKLTSNMMRDTYLLAGASEIEILSRLHDRRMMWRPTIKLGTSVPVKLLYNYRRIIRKLDDYKDRAEVEGKKLTRQEILLAMPKTKVLTSKPILKKVREADRSQRPVDMSTTFITDDEWDDVLYGYQDTYIPTNRGPENVLGFEKVRGGKQEVYGWEVENELTNDFVTATRKGQTEAAQANGIKDFVWIAVIDNRTCDCKGCCLPRDGLTTSEIESLLKTKWRNATITVSVPPAHFSCRCTIAPVTKDLPPVPKSMIGDFNDWLES